MTPSSSLATNSMRSSSANSNGKAHASMRGPSALTSSLPPASPPSMDGVYKLSAIRDPGENWKYKLKLSEQMIKVSNPGILQVKRYANKEGYTADAIYDTKLGITPDGQIVDPFDPTRLRFINKSWSAQDLLVPIFKEGKSVYDSPPLPDIRDHPKGTGQDPDRRQTLPQPA